ncbi:hypothetical protein DICA0_B00892 [Diutina catenulata]
MIYYGRPYYENPRYPPAPVAAQLPGAPPAGGINSVLEYDLHKMATFVSWCAFGMLKSHRSPSPEFENLMVSVLFATRLPRSTIIIGLEYMNQRFYAGSAQGGAGDHLSDHDVFTYLVVALVLANKFNDDNTFTNKSWCGATGVALAQLNQQEAAWLAHCKWNLNVVNFEQNIVTLEDCWRTWLDKCDAVPVSVPVSPFAPKYAQLPPVAPATPVTPSYSSFTYSSPTAYPSYSHYPNYSYVPAPSNPYAAPTYQYSSPHHYQSPVFDPVIQYAQKTVNHNPYYYSVY